MWKHLDSVKLTNTLLGKFIFIITKSPQESEEVANFIISVLKLKKLRQ